MTVFTPGASEALDGPDWLRTRRVTAAERFAAMSLPTEAEEIWRYSRISQLDLDYYSLAALAPPADSTLGSGVEAVLASRDRCSACVVVHNGRVTSVYLDPGLGGRGLVVGDAAQLSGGGDLFADDESPVDAFTELNTAFGTAAVAVRVPAGLTVEHPVVVLHRVDCDRGAVFPRTVVQSGEDASVVVIEHYVSTDVEAFVAPVVRLKLADASRLRYLCVQELGPRVFQVAHQASRVGRDASLHSSVVALGGDYARVRTDSRIEGKGGSANLNAAYFADGSRMHDFRTLQDHAAPASNSDLLFKGAVQDSGRSVYSGLIRIAKSAPGSNAFQTNRNLVLSDGASAESVPNLEIETDDVRCSHASAVGPIDEEQRYYLEARGIPPEVAERLIVVGFLGEVLDRIPSPELVTALKHSVASRLNTKRPDPAPSA